MVIHLQGINSKLMKMNIVILLAMILTSCIRNAEPEQYLVPEGFVGTVVVFFDQDSVAKEYSNDSIRIHRVPRNGILKSGFSRSKGILNQSFFYVDSTGSIISELEYVLKEPDSKKNENYVYGIFDGKMTMNPMVSDDRRNYSNKDSEKRDYIYFSVGSVEEMTQNIEASHKRIEEVLKKMKSK